MRGAEAKKHPTVRQTSGDGSLRQEKTIFARVKKICPPCPMENSLMSGSRVACLCRGVLNAATAYDM